MRIPFWQRDQAHPTKAIDRLQKHRSSRLVIGVWTSSDYSRVTATLVQVKGTGKFARFEERNSASLAIEDSARKIFDDLLAEDSPRESDIQFASTELVSYQADVCRTLLSDSGVHASDIVALGVMDPGLQIVDFDGKASFRSLTNSVELASRTSITVVDRFRERDMIDGGNGNDLLALGYWFLLGDRNPKVAQEHRLLYLNRASQSRYYFLPASDGLDATLPAIELIPSEVPDVESELSNLVERFRPQDESMSLIVVSEKPMPTNLGLAGETEIISLSDFGFSHLDSVATAFLANAFVDQLPISLPGLTGNQNPRVLGTLTPGSLVNFRNYVLQASKVTPSIMKLRDAI